MRTLGKTMMRAALAGVLTLCGAAASWAQGPDIVQVGPRPDLFQPENRQFLTGGIGIFNVRGSKKSVDFRLEYRGPKVFWEIKPFLGASVTTRGAFYATAGVGIDLFLDRRIVVTPNFGPSLYLEGDDKDLGYELEFRSGIEVAYRFDDGSRFGVSLHHLSNAGLGDDNPGTEVVMLTYSRPLDALIGNFGGQ